MGQAESQNENIHFCRGERHPADDRCTLITFHISPHKLRQIDVLIQAIACWGRQTISINNKLQHTNHVIVNQLLTQMFSSYLVFRFNLNTQWLRLFARCAFASSLGRFVGNWILAASTMGCPFCCNAFVHKVTACRSARTKTTAHRHPMRCKTEKIRHTLSIA